MDRIVHAGLHHYAAYGLTLASEIDCPELCLTTGIPDVRIRRGTTPDHLERPRVAATQFEAEGNRCLLHVDGVGRYLVEDGREILIEQAPHTTERAVRTLLLGHVFGLLLHQRRILPLHAAAVSTARGAVLLAGQSGHGKSTLLGALLNRGYAMLADDLTAITLGERGQPIVHPGFPQMKLWADAARHLGRATDRLHRILPGVEKFAVPTAASFAARSQPLAAIYVLDPCDQPEIHLEALADTDCFDAVCNHTYQWWSVLALGTQAAHFRLATAVASAVPIVHLRRPRSPYLLNELVDLLEKELS
jgi:hypothetical protein